MMILETLTYFQTFELKCNVLIKAFIETKCFINTLGSESLNLS